MHRLAISFLLGDHVRREHRRIGPRVFVEPPRAQPLKDISLLNQ
jgi:hypothetical protein